MRHLPANVFIIVIIFAAKPLQHFWLRMLAITILACYDKWQLYLFHLHQMKKYNISHQNASFIH